MSKSQTKIEIRLHNTASKSKETLRPLDPANVRMYVCGPTVYDRAHIGNARPAVVFDVLFRFLRHVYGPDGVTYARNITDIDDKIIDRARETGRAIEAVTEETTGWYLDDMAALGVLLPTHAPRATEYVEAMVGMIETLLAKGHAYVAEGHVLFNVSSFTGYGALSHRSLEDMIAGSRVEVAPYKRGPMDFVMWKPSSAEQPGWASPWGRGRPGWHIECSVMAGSLLGETFDIHGGGIDLAFPHHENERAQSLCAHGTDIMAQIWMHNGFLQVEGEKMSKSLGNFFTVRDLLDQGWPGEVIRFVLLSTQYRKPMDWTEKAAEEAMKTLRKWRALVEGIEPSPSAASAVADALGDDLNTPAAIAALHQAAREGDAVALVSGAAVLGLLEPALGGWEAAPELGDAAALIEAAIARRAEAKAARDFATADGIRTALAAAGVTLTDGPGGETEYAVEAGFDAAKLEALS
ncbi:MAG: cysteine--tRNA ligase [Pseudomonadota bacterium]